MLRTYSIMMPVINRYGVRLLMPHFASMNQPKESVIISQELMKGILKEVLQVVGLNVSKGLEYIPTLTTSITNLKSMVE